MTGNSRIYSRIAIAVLIVASAAVHAFVAQSAFGFEVDVRDFAIWGRRLADLGPASFYAHDYWCDYPPGYILVAGLLRRIVVALNANEGTALWLIVVKAPACLADCVTGWLVWRIAARVFANRRHGDIWALVAAACYLFNPAALVDSALWGQVDGVLSVFVIAMFACYLRAFDAWEKDCRACEKDEKDSARNAKDGDCESAGVKPSKRLDGDTLVIVWMTVGSALWAVGITMKLQGALIAPAVLFVFLMLIRRSLRTGLVSLGISFLAALLVAVFVLLPFSPVIGVWSLLQVFLETLGSYQFGSVNAFNFFTMVGAGWADQELPFLFLTYRTWGTIFLVLLVAFTVACYVRAEWSQELRTALFGRDVGALGSNVVSPNLQKRPCISEQPDELGQPGEAGPIADPVKTRKRKQADALFGMPVALSVLLAGVLVVGFFTFSVRVHERYVFYAIALLLLAAVLYRDKHLVAIFVLVSVIETVNLVMVFNGSYFFGNTLFDVAASALMVATCIYLFVRTWQLSNPKGRKGRKGANLRSLINSKAQ